MKFQILKLYESDTSVQIKYPIKLDKIFEKLKKNNIKPIIIGGYVRDTLLGKDSKDIDIELYGVKNYEQVLTLVREFGKTVVVGKSFGVVKLFMDGLDIDFSLPRKESKTAKGHTGFAITVDPTLDFTTAASRRDFTINAIGYDVFEKKILDPFGGQRDLHNKILRAVNIEKFAEDPLRVYRAVQFSARFALTIDAKLLQLCKKIIIDKEIYTLASERISDELKKLLLQAQKPSRGFTLMEQIGLLTLFQELQQLPNHIYKTNLQLLDKIPLQTKQTEPKKALTILLALLVRCLPTQEQIQLLHRFTHDKSIINSVTTLHQYLTSPSYSLAMKLDKQVMMLYCKVFEIKNHAYIINQITPKIMGKHLIQQGYKQSKEFSIMLEQQYQEQIQPILPYLTLCGCE